MAQPSSAGGSDRKPVAPVARLVVAVVILVVLVFGARRLLTDGADQVADPTDAQAPVAEDAAPEPSTEAGEPASAAASESSDEGDAPPAPPADPAPAASFSMNDLPEWVLLYPGATLRDGNLSPAETGRMAGAFLTVTADGVDDVLAYYERVLGSRGYAATRRDTRASANGQPGGVVLGELDAPARSLGVIVTQEGDETLINTEFDGESE